MKKILLILVGVACCAVSIQAQPTSTVNLTGFGGFNNTYTLGYSSPYGEGGTLYHYRGAPYNDGIPQFIMNIIRKPDGTYYVTQVREKIGNAIIGQLMFNSDLTIQLAQGYGIGLDYSGHSVTWDGGGIGPGYERWLAASARAQDLSKGLEFSDGRWRVLE